MGSDLGWRQRGCKGLCGGEGGSLVAGGASQRLQQHWTPAAKFLHNVPQTPLPADLIAVQLLTQEVPARARGFAFIL